MIILTMISFLVGAVLGLNFKVWILVPATGLALILVALDGVVVKEGISQLVGAMTLASIFLQLGYVGGSILQFAISTACVTDHDGAAMLTSIEVPPDELRNRTGASSRFKTGKRLNHA
jgi:hypothetical protein